MDLKMIQCDQKTLKHHQIKENILSDENTLVCILVLD